MNVTVLGSGGAWPDADRNSPAFLVQHQGRPYLVDCGGGTCHHLMKVRVPPSSLDVILFTHKHIDHCVEFPSLVFGGYLTGKEGSYHVYGPPGTKHFTTSTFESTYDFAGPMMIQLRKKEISIITEEVPEGVFYNQNGLRIQSRLVKHGGIPVYAYRFEADGRSLVFSSDTEPCDSIEEISRDADLLIIECSFPEATGPKPGHLIPSQVGRIASAAKAKRVVLNHLFPICKGKEAGIIADVKKLYDGPVEIAEDLQVYDV